MWTYTLNNSDPDTAALRNGQSVTDAFNIMTEDGTPTTVTITVSGADDESSIGGNLAGAVTEDDSTNNTASGTVTVTGGVTITAKNETSAYGTFTLGTNGNWTYSLDDSFPATNALAGGATVLDAFTIAASDNSSATVIITITGASDTLMIMIGNTGAQVVEDDADKGEIEGTVTLTDPDTTPLPTITEETRTGRYGRLTIARKTLGINDGEYTWTYRLDNEDSDTNRLTENQEVFDTFTIRATDRTMKTLTVIVIGADDRASIVVTRNGDDSVTEDDSNNNVVSGTLTVTDPDTASLPVIAEVPIPGTYGSLDITLINPFKGLYVWTYSLDNANSKTNELTGGETVTDTLRIKGSTDDSGSDGGKDDGKGDKSDKGKTNGGESNAIDLDTTVTITIIGANDPAAIAGDTTGAITEGTASTTGTVTSTDVDGDDNAFKTQVSPATGTYGRLIIGTDGNWAYNLDNSPGGAIKKLTNVATATDEFSIMAADGTQQTITISVTKVAGIDLIVGSVSGLPMQWNDGTGFTATASIRNSGTKDAGTFDVGLYASRIQTITTSDTLIGRASVKALTKGSSTNVSLQVSGGFDTFGLSPGTYYLGVIADIGDVFGQVTETNESNNNDHAISNPHTVSLLKDQPDLVITSVSGLPAQWKDGTDLASNPSVVVRNGGEADAGAFVIGLYASVDQTITTGDIPIGTVSVSALAKDTSTTETIMVSGRFSALGLSPGTYHLGVIADISGQVVESDESNNDDYANSNPHSITLTPSGANPPTPTPQPNLGISSVSGLPRQWKDGERFTVFATVQNQGKAEVPARTASSAISSANNATFVTGLYASTDAIITTGDIRIGRAFSFGSLPNGQSVTVSLRIHEKFKDLGLTPGTYYLGVIPDIDGRVNEENEFDNNLYAMRNPATVSLLASDETISIDNRYDSRWGWRGKGVSGPRGVEVAPWGPTAPLSTFETTESNRIGWVLDLANEDVILSETTSRDWEKHPNALYDGGDPLGAIGARDAYALGLDGNGVVVAVADRHIDNTHVDLDGNFLKHYDASTTKVVENGKFGAHGTHVAGIIAAEADGQGMHGVAPRANLVGISFGSLSDGRLDISFDGLADSITSALNDGARIFNNSWGTGAVSNTGASSALSTSYKLRNAMAAAIDEGAVFVWSAGNEYQRNAANSNLLPDQNTSEYAKAARLFPDELGGGFVNVVNLTWDQVNSRWTIANSLSGTSVPPADGTDTFPDSQICGVTKDYCLGAPGTWIVSTHPENKYASRAGTSMAAPMVSGGLAILFQAFPYVETSDILRLLFETATDLGEEGVDSVYGRGMMNLKAALNPVGSASIPIKGSTAASAGIDVQASALLAETPLRTAVASATADMVMLDDYDRAFVIGDVMDDLAISDIQPLSIASADAVFASVDTELASLRDFGSPITQAAAKAGALTIIGDRLALPSQSGTSEVVLNSIATEDSGLAEFRYVATRSEEGWKASQSLGVIVEEDQLFGNKGRGAYALASQATTLSLGTSGQRDLAEGVTLFGGLGLSRTEVSAADQSLVSLSSQFTSASGVMGLRMRDLGAEDRGEFAIQLGQDRAILSGEGSISVPVGREEGGVILFDQVQFDSATLGLEPELMMSYANEYAPDASYSLSAAGRGEETILSAEWQRNF